MATTRARSTPTKVAKVPKKPAGEASKKTASLNKPAKEPAAKAVSKGVAKKTAPTTKPTKKPAKKSAAKTANSPINTAPVKKSAKKAAKSTPKKTPKKAPATLADDADSGAEGSPPVNYCEADRRKYGTYEKSGAGALYTAHYESPEDEKAAVTAADTRPAVRGQSSAKTARSGIPKDTSSKITKTAKARKTGLNYDAVVRGGAHMVLQGLGDLWERITGGPINSEPSLVDVRVHMASAVDTLHKFLDSSGKHANPRPEVDFRKEFEEGSGRGNWIVFKPTWFEYGRFDVKDTIMFESTLQGLKAEGRVISLIS